MQIRALALGLLVVLVGFQSEAATISVVPTNDPNFSLIAVDGEILPTDFEQFRQRVATISKAGVIFQSPGGNVLAAIEIGRLIRLRNFATWVPDNMGCASACALAWLGGSRRFMGTKALIGFHAAYNSLSGQESGLANALVGAYLNEIALPYPAVAYITKAAPASMTWLTLADARQVGIDVSVLDANNTNRTPPQAEQRSPTPSAPILSPANAGGAALSGAFQLERRSRDFIAELYQATSNTSNATVLAGFYANSVRYYGKETQRNQLVDRIQQFNARWPVRDYTPVNRTVKIECNQSSLSCHASGEVLFDARSTARNQRSRGRATFDYIFRFTSLDQPAPLIISEDGTVLERHKEAFVPETQGSLWGHLFGK